MKKTRARVEPLFTGLERAGLASMLLLLFVFGMVCMAAPRIEPDPEGISLLVKIYSYWRRFAGVYAGMLESLVGFVWFGFAVWLWIDTFLRLRRNPLAVTRNVVCFAGCLLAVILLRAPEDIGYLVTVIRVQVSSYDERAYFAAIADLEVRFLCLAMLVAIVVFGGELSQAARQRILQAEWAAGQNAPEEERLKWRRREALILTVRGPRLPLYTVVLRLLALLLAPFAVAWGIATMMDEVKYFGGDLPAPAMTKTGPAAIDPRRLVGEIRIDVDSVIYLGGDVVAQPQDRDCERLVSLLKRTATMPDNAVLLRVHPEVRFDRVVDVISAAHRAGVRLAQEE